MGVKAQNMANRAGDPLYAGHMKYKYDAQACSVNLL